VGESEMAGSIKSRLDRLERAIKTKDKRAKMFVAREDGLYQDGAELITKEELERRYPDMVTVTVGFDVSKI